MLTLEINAFGVNSLRRTFSHWWSVKRAGKEQYQGMPVYLHKWQQGADKRGKMATVFRISHGMIAYYVPRDLNIYTMFTAALSTCVAWAVISQK